MSIDIRVLRAGQRDPGTEVQALLPFLDEETRARTLAMGDIRDAWGRAGAHVLCRVLLCAYFGETDPTIWSFGRGAFGKPCLSGPYSSDRTVDFSLTHTRGLCACALVRGTSPTRPKVGLDAESLDRSVNAMTLAKRFLHSREAAFLEALPIEKQAGAFVRLWTLKEAVVKALGGGLQEDLRGFCVDGPLDSPRVALAPTPFGPLESWTLRDLPVDPGFAVSLAVCAGGGAAPRIEVLDGVGWLGDLLSSR